MALAMTQTYAIRIEFRLLSRLGGTCGTMFTMVFVLPRTCSHTNYNLHQKFVLTKAAAAAIKNFFTAPKHYF